jgi:hypothetical protein
MDESLDSGGRRFDVITLERVGELVESYHDQAEDRAATGRSLTPEAMRKLSDAATRAKREAARAFYAPILEPVKQLRAEGLTLRAIASILNSEGHRTRRGRFFRAEQVQRVLNMADA